MHKHGEARLPRLGRLWGVRGRFGEPLLPCVSRSRRKPQLAAQRPMVFEASMKNNPRSGRRITKSANPRCIRRVVGRCGRNKALLTKIGAGSYDGETQVLCPVCGDDYVHHENRADVIIGKDDYQAAPGMVRGDVIALPMYCESGHNFVLCFGFHKGCTFTWCVKYSGKLASPNTVNTKPS